MPKGKGASTKKKLTVDKKPAVKLKAKAKLGTEVAEKVLSARSTRLRRQSSTDAFGTLEYLSPPEYTLFDQPDGATSATARGCKTATVTLGPLAGFTDVNSGTDAEAVWPSAIEDVRAKIQGYTWISGHVINADFGGFGGSDENMTCLTSSANSQQKAFDSNVKHARTYLHQVYTALREAGKKSDFFSGFGYGIELELEMSDATWGRKYPYNCVSNTMSLAATVVNEPSEEEVRAAMGDATEVSIGLVLAAIKNVEKYVGDANQRHTVRNNK